MENADRVFNKDTTLEYSSGWENPIKMRKERQQASVQLIAHSALCSRVITSMLESAAHQLHQMVESEEYHVPKRADDEEDNPTEEEDEIRWKDLLKALRSHDAEDGHTPISASTAGLAPRESSEEVATVSNGALLARLRAVFESLVILGEPVKPEKLLELLEKNASSLAATEPIKAPAPQTTRTPAHDTVEHPGGYACLNDVVVVLCGNGWHLSQVHRHGSKGIVRTVCKRRLNTSPRIIKQNKISTALGLLNAGAGLTIWKPELIASGSQPCLPHGVTFLESKTDVSRQRYPNDDQDALIALIRGPVNSEADYMLDSFELLKDLKCLLGTKDLSTVTELDAGLAARRDSDFWKALKKCLDSNELDMPIQQLLMEIAYPSNTAGA